MRLKLLGLTFETALGVWSLGKRDGWEVSIERTTPGQRDLRGAYGDEDCDGASLWLGSVVAQFDFGRKAAERAADRAASVALYGEGEQPALAVVGAEAA
jgi:hypothetical protein